MAITRVASYNWTAGASIAISPPNAGDLILLFIYKDGSTSSPAPAGTTYTTVVGSGANTNAAWLGYKISDGTETSLPCSATFNTATVVIYRGVNTSAPIGGYAITGASSTSVTYPALTMTNTTGTSWVIGAAGHRSTNTAIETAPGGMTAVDDTLTSLCESAFHDTNGDVSSWGGATVSVGGTSSGWRAITCELLSADSTKYISAAIVATESLGAGGATPSVGAHVSASSTINTTTTGAVTTTSGGTIYAFVIADLGVTTLSVTDNKGNTYTQISSGERTTSGASCALFRCVDFVGGSGHTFTGASSSTYYVSIVAVEVLNVASSTQEEAITALADDMSSPFTTSITTTDAGLVLVFNTSSGVSYVSPLTAVEEFVTSPTTYWSIHCAEHTDVSAGSHTYTINSSSADVLAAAVALKPASSGAIPIERTRGHSVSVIESSTVGAALQKLQTVALSIAEAYSYTIDIDKTSAGGTTKFVTLSVDEAGEYSGAIARSRAVIATLNDVLSYAATISRQRTTAMSVSESVALTETIARVRGLQAALTEQYGSTTSAVRARGLQATIDELEAVAVQATKVKLLALLIAETESTSNVIVKRVRNGSFSVALLHSIEAAFVRARNAIITVPQAESVAIDFGRIRAEALSIAEEFGVDVAVNRVREVLADIATSTGYTFTVSSYTTQDTSVLQITVSWSEWVYANDALTLTPKSANIAFSGKSSSSALVAGAGETIIVLPADLYTTIVLPD